MTEKQPETESATPTEALDWSLIFGKRFQETCQTEFHNLPKNSSEEDFQRAATNAFVFTMRESGSSREELFRVLEEALLRTKSLKVENWTEAKNQRRAVLIEKKSVTT